MAWSTGVLTGPVSDNRSNKNPPKEFVGDIEHTKKINLTKNKRNLFFLPNTILVMHFQIE